LSHQRKKKNNNKIIIIVKKEKMMKKNRKDIKTIKKIKISGPETMTFQS
jgi:hypothetical protein